MRKSSGRTPHRAAECCLPAIAWLAAPLALVIAIINGPAMAQSVTASAATPTAVAAESTDDPVAQRVTVFVDFAAVVRIMGDVSAIVLGNADIADATLVATGTVVLTGKAIGSTNVMVLGLQGDVLSEFYVQVAGHKPGTVTVRRALLANSYLCTESSCQYSGKGPELGMSKD